MEVKFKLRIDQDFEVFDRVSPGNVLVREIIWCVTRGANLVRECCTLSVKWQFAKWLPKT